MAKKFFETLSLSEDEFRKDLQRRIDLDESQPVIAAAYGTTAATIHNWCKRFDISRRRNLRSKEFLELQYLTNKKSAEDIARDLGVTAPAVRWHLVKNGIPLRTLSQVQKIAQPKRAISPLHEYGSFRSRGYCFRYRGIYCRSVGELLWLIQNNYRFERIQWEPFVINNHKPDALVDGVVYEIKSTRSSLSDKQWLRYQNLATIVQDATGHEYRMAFMQDDSPHEYADLLKQAKAAGATVGWKGRAIDWPNAVGR